MIQTSYFAVARKSVFDNPISISLQTPTWFRGRRYPDLAPRPWILSDYHRHRDEAKYIKDFNAHVLGGLDPKQVIEDLGEDPTICCYETPGVFCHRHLVAQWLQPYTNTPIREYKP